MDLLTQLKNEVSYFNNHVTIFNNRDSFYKTKQWIRTRAYIVDRDNNECQTCRDRGLVTTKAQSILIAHHIEPIEFKPDRALDPDNLVTVCASCHNYIHGTSFKKKANKWADEWW